LSEKALIYHDLDDLEKRNQTISECAAPVVHVTNLRLLLGLVERLKYLKIDDPFSKFLWRAIYKPKIAKAILKSYRQSNPLLQRYISHISRDVEVYADSALMIAEHSNDPAVLLACMKQLLIKQEPMLILLILELIQSARLSNRDAVELLQINAEWSIAQLASHAASDDIDRLITSILPQLGQTAKLNPAFLSELMLRALPFERDSGVIIGYLQYLISNERNEGFLQAMAAFENNLISKEEVEAIFAISPKAALEILENAPKSSEQQYWIEWTVAKFPESAGIIKKGVRIKTPVGTGIVDAIQNLSGQEINHTLLSNCSVRINLLIGDGSERMRIWLNLDNDTMKFFEANDGWKCEYCNFTHPDNRIMDKHYKKNHGFTARKFKHLTGVFPISRSDLALE
jgi:hypothetical protein